LYKAGAKVMEKYFHPKKWMIFFKKFSPFI